MKNPEPQPTYSTDPGLDRLRADKDGWLKVIYAEAWKQYVHEDSLTNTRATVFQVVPIALLAYIGSASFSITNIGCGSILGITVHLCLALAAVNAILVSSLALALIRAFVRVTAAGHSYVLMRHTNLRAIERVVAIGTLGPALLEHRVRTHYGSSTSTKPFLPYSGIPELAEFKDLTVSPYPGFGGFSYLRLLARIWRITFGLVLVVAVLTAGISVAADKLTPEISLPLRSCQKT